MVVLNDADAVRFGQYNADAVYLGTEAVWPTKRVGVWNIKGCKLGLVGEDVAAGAVSSWPDRSPVHNNVVPYTGTPISSGKFVTATTANTLGTTSTLGITGNSPFHLLMAMRSRSVGRFVPGLG